jgi:DNA-binding transcriptional regulator YdaS (Cro superfamily)
MQEALLRAIEVAGGLSSLARRIGVQPQVIANWKHRGVPAERVLEVERATADEAGEPRVTRSELRPDLYPPTEPLQLSLPGAA